jgi:hypothetical protein
VTDYKNMTNKELEQALRDERAKMANDYYESITDDYEQIVEELLRRMRLWP